MKSKYIIVLVLLSVEVIILKSAIELKLPPDIKALLSGISVYVLVCIVNVIRRQEDQNGKS